MPRQFIRNLTGRNRSRRADRQLGLLLTFVAGAVNAGGFLAVGQYTSHMTGIASAIADYIALSQFEAAVRALGFLAAFLSGALVSTLVIRWAAARQMQAQYALALMLEALLLLAFGALAARLTFPISTVIALLCFIMGLQNAIITKISNAEIRTTHVTGIVTDIGIELGRYFHSRVRDDRLGLHAGLLLSFLSGGVAGAFAFQYAGYIATVPLALLLLLAASIPIWDDIRLGRS